MEEAVCTVVSEGRPALHWTLRRCQREEAWPGEDGDEGGWIGRKKMPHETLPDVLGTFWMATPSKRIMGDPAVPKCHPTFLTANHKLVMDCPKKYLPLSKDFHECCYLSGGDGGRMSSHSWAQEHPEEQWPSRSWGVEVRGWIPFELRGSRSSGVWDEWTTAPNGRLLKVQSTWS